MVNNAEQILWKSSHNFKINLFSLYLFHCYKILKIDCLIYIFPTYEEKLQKSMHLSQFGGKEKDVTSNQSCMIKIFNVTNANN